MVVHEPGQAELLGYNPRLVAKPGALYLTSPDNECALVFVLFTGLMLGAVGGRFPVRRAFTPPRLESLVWAAGSRLADPLLKETP